MRYASVCSGVEAASLAWGPLGWKPAWFSEIEPFPSAVLAYRWPDVPNLGDMTKINGKDHYGAVDLLVGGTPCQGFSIAGRRCGLDDGRSCLARKYVELLGDIRSAWFVWENVPGVLSSAGGGDFQAILGAFAERGYCCAWRILDVQYVRVDGFGRAVPQRRRRLTTKPWLMPGSLAASSGAPISTASSATARAHGPCPASGIGVCPEPGNCRSCPASDNGGYGRWRCQMATCKRIPQHGDYVLATKYNEGGPRDHFAIGFYDRPLSDRHIVVDAEGKPQRANGFRRVDVISGEVGAVLVENIKLIEQSACSVWWWRYHPGQLAKLGGM